MAVETYTDALVRPCHWVSVDEDLPNPFLVYAHHGVVPHVRGIHSFPFQLNLSPSVHRITQLNSRMCPGVLKLSSKRERV